MQRRVFSTFHALAFANAALAAFLCVSPVATAADSSPTQPAATPAAGSLRYTQRLADGWKFTKGNPDGAAAPGFDDRQWQSVHVPHDWAISGAMDKHGDSNSRFNWHGDGWYRLHLPLPAAAAGKRIYLDFDGVMAFPQVYVNGQLAGGWDYGYNAFRVDATDFAHAGQDNVIAVYANTTNHESRWYPGAGIYRKVVLTINDPVHVSNWGTQVTTPEVSASQAKVVLATTIDNHQPNGSAATLTTEIFAPGKPDAPIATTSDTAVVAAGGQYTFKQTFVIDQPELWNVGDGKLYRAVSTIRADGKDRDRYETNIGIRTLVFTKDDGLHVNGKRVQIHGVNLHHDQGPLGGAFHPRALERQIEIMRSMGVNAIRTSHNPPARELFDMADKLGILVFAEAFDKWDQTIDRLPTVNLADYGRKQIGAYLTRERNHPSIMIWSIGNEIWDIEGNYDGNSAAKVGMMAGFVREFDATRPVTMATHMLQAINSGIFAHLDVQSWNYGRKYALGRQVYPDMPSLMSESSSGVSTRGYYVLQHPAVKDTFGSTPQVDSYDLNAVSWGDIADVEFDALSHYGYPAGEFVWSGFDYIGEPTPYPDDARSSYFGIVDLVGLPKDRYFLYRSYWRPDAPMVHILPHWTWPDRVGQNVPVYVYTTGDAAELFLNGTSLGMRHKVEPSDQPVNLALHKLVTTSGDETANHNVAANVVDGDAASRWCAADGSPNQWLQIDLGAVQHLRMLYLNFEQDAYNYQYVIKGSSDGAQWQTLAVKGDFNASELGGTHLVDTQSRFIRIEFTALRPGVWASIREFEAYSAPVDRSYFSVTNRYRLRWENVTYKPGTLTAVAYANGKKIGEAQVATAGTRTQLTLKADRAQVHADGDDLSYLTIAARDDQGTVEPDDTAIVHLSLNGPGDLVGVGNGDPLSGDPFVASDVRLFHGRAVAIVRTRAGQAGTITVTAEAPGLKPAVAEVTVK